MKTIKKYVDEISGKEFNKKEDAIKSEKKSIGIKDLFSFWKEHPDDGTCRFENGGWCYQRTENEYFKLKDSIIKAVKTYEPWIAKEYKKNGGLKREHVHESYVLGRYLYDSDSGIYRWYGLLSNICPTCYRQWGQQYYANNCSHSVEPRGL